MMLPPEHTEPPKAMSSSTALTKRASAPGALCARTDEGAHDLYTSALKRTHEETIFLTTCQKRARSNPAPSSHFGIPPPRLFRRCRFRREPTSAFGIATSITDIWEWCWISLTAFPLSSNSNVMHHGPLKVDRIARLARYVHGSKYSNSDWGRIWLLRSFAYPPRTWVPENPPKDCWPKCPTIEARCLTVAGICVLAISRNALAPTLLAQAGRTKAGTLLTNAGWHVPPAQLGLYSSVSASGFDLDGPAASPFTAPPITLGVPWEVLIPAIPVCSELKGDDRHTYGRSVVGYNDPSIVIERL